MAPLEYIAEALDSWPQYVLLAALFLSLHWVLVKRWSVGLYDPLLLLLLSNAFGWTIVWFMYLRGDIAGVYVATFTAAQLAFYAGLGTGRRAVAPASATPAAIEETAVPKLTLVLASVAHVASTLAVWGIAGIPLFRESRLGAFEGSGGLGILERVTESSALIAVFSMVFLLIRSRPARRSLLVHAFFVWFLVSIALSGSKGALLSVGQYVLSILFVYTGLRHRRDSFWGGHAGKWLLIASVLFAVGVLATTQQEGGLANAGLGFVYRIVSYGDVYIFAYPDATIELVKGDNVLVGMFGGFLSTFRLFPQDLVYPNIGYQFTGIVFPDLNLIVGPNPQHPVFGYHYFGAFGFIFSFLLGLATIRAHTRFYHRAHRTFISGLFAFVLYFSLVNISVDFEYTLSKLASMIIGSVLIVLPALLVHPRVAIIRLRRQAAAS